jgi:hypothetical protein
MLASSRVQLGEQMQIHELTRKKPVKEGIGGALASIAGGIAMQAGKQAINKAVGTDVTSQAGPAQSREQGFASMVNSPAAKTLATSMQAAWAETVRNFLANSRDSMGNPPTSVKTITSPSTDALKTELRALVNKMIGGQRAGFDYSNMANNISDPVTKAGSQEIISRINEYIESIFDATVQGVDPKTMSNSWIKLVGDGILPAQNVRAYDSRSGSVITMSPGATKLADSLRLDDGDIVKIRQAISNPDGARVATAILDKKIPATIASPLIKQFGQQTKLTDTELTSMLALAQDSANDAAFKEIFGLRA